MNCCSSSSTDLQAVAQIDAARAPGSAGVLLDTGRPEHALKTLARETDPPLTHRTVVSAGHADPLGVRRVSRGVGILERVSIRGVSRREFILGNKNARMLRMFYGATGTARGAGDGAPGAERLRRVPAAARAPRARRSPSRARSRRIEGLGVGGWARADVPRIYEHVAEHWDVYELCESLIDIEDAFQLWRFRHLSTVQRIIGFKRGTGGSSGWDSYARPSTSPSS